VETESLKPSFEHEEEEILDLVDDNDEVVGTIRRGDMMSLKETPGRYIRAVDIFIQRSNGDIYLPRRSKGKKLFPGGLDLSAAGHLNSGETYEEACVREVKEETGIVTTPDDFHFIAKLKPTPQLFYFDVIYLLRTDEEPKLSPEHTEGTWINPSQLETTVGNDVPTKHTLTTDIPILINYLNNEQAV
jgi:isopentenyldiphosphate isomerase